MLNRTYKLVQSSVQIDGLLGELGPLNVSPHLIPLHAFICEFLQYIIYHKKKEVKRKADVGLEESAFDI